MSIQSTIDPTPAILKPKTPKAGEKVTLIYDPSASPAGLTEADDVTAQILLVGSERRHMARKEVSLTRNGNRWQGEFEIKSLLISL